MNCRDDKADEVDDQKSKTNSGRKGLKKTVGGTCSCRLFLSSGQEAVRQGWVVKRGGMRYMIWDTYVCGRRVSNSYSMDVFWSAFRFVMNPKVGKNNASTDILRVKKLDFYRI